MTMADMESRLLEDDRLLAELNANMKAAFRRIDEQKQLTETVQQLAYSVRDLVKSQEATDKSVKLLQTDMAEIKARPQKRWDMVITAIITSVIAFFVGKFMP